MLKVVERLWFQQRETEELRRHADITAVLDERIQQRHLTTNRLKHRVTTMPYVLEVCLYLTVAITGTSARGREPNMACRFTIPG